MAGKPGRWNCSRCEQSRRAERRGWVGGASLTTAEPPALRGASSSTSQVCPPLSIAPGGMAEWLRLRPQVTTVDDVVSMDRPVIFAASKDRPILFSALAWAEVLLTLDKADFADVLGGMFYGLAVLLPYDFLERERAAGRL